MNPTIAILVTLDTKAAEADYLRERVEALGGQALIIDIGVVGEPGTEAQVSRERVAEAGGKPLAEILRAPTRQDASPVMVAGATSVLTELLAKAEPGQAGQSVEQELARDPELAALLSVLSSAKY